MLDGASPLVPTHLIVTFVPLRTFVPGMKEIVP